MKYTSSYLGEDGWGRLLLSQGGLVIEVDGDIHDLQQEEDARREKVLSEMGLRVVRFRNEEVMKNLAGAASSLCSLLM